MKGWYHATSTLGVLDVEVVRLTNGTTRRFDRAVAASWTWLGRNVPRVLSLCVVFLWLLEINEKREKERCIDKGQHHLKGLEQYRCTRACDVLLWVTRHSTMNNNARN